MERLNWSIFAIFHWLLGDYEKYSGTTAGYILLPRFVYVDLRAAQNWTHDIVWLYACRGQLCINVMDAHVPRHLVQYTFHFWPSSVSSSLQHRTVRSVLLQCCVSLPFVSHAVIGVSVSWQSWWMQLCSWTNRQTVGRRCLGKSMGHHTRYIRILHHNSI